MQTNIVTAAVVAQTSFIWIHLSGGTLSLLDNYTTDDFEYNEIKICLKC